MNFDKIIDGMRDEIIKSTQRTIKNNSVKTSKAGDMPFGEDIHKCFIDFLKNGEELGFTTKNVDNFAGHIEMGSGDEIVGILAHLDVVPEGDYWTYPPYGGEIHDDRIYGRGTIDDKGPAVACLYAMKALQESGVSLNKKIRLILGLDEESGSTGIAHYLTKEPTPDTGFTPDADFPVIHGEKGITTVDLIKAINTGKADDGVRLLSMSGGNKANMVPDYCEASLSKELDLQSLLATYLKENQVDITIEENSDTYILKAKGVSAHGSLPEKGVNSISILMDFLSTLSFAQKDVQNFIRFYIQCLGHEVNGERMGCNFSDEQSGLLTFNAGVIKMEGNHIVLTCNLRYPVTTIYKEIIKGMQGVIAPYEMSLEELTHVGPLYISKDTPLVKQLLDAYTEYVPGKCEPITIGGGTYARSCDNILAFGPLLPGREELAHQKDEYMSIDDIITITKIYAKAIYLLAQ